MGWGLVLSYRVPYLMIKAEGIICALIILAISSLGIMANHYRENALNFKTQRDAAKQSLSVAIATIADMQTRQRDVAALDTQYTKELADAHTENDRLRAKLACGGRVRVAGECKTNAASPSSMGKAGTVELSSGAGSNVLDIRAGIITSEGSV